MSRRFVIEHNRTSRAAPEQVYALLTDSMSWPAWSPVQKAEIEIPGGPGGQGEVRTFRTGPVATKEEVVVCSPPHEYSYLLISGIPVRNYRSDITIERTATGSKIVWRSEFEPRWPGSGAINKAILSPFVKLMLKRLARHAE